MARTSVRTYVECPHCGSEYSSFEDEHHQEGCPRPLERHVESLGMKLAVQTCPLCKNPAYVNNGDCFECTTCHAHWIPSWTQGPGAIEASTVSFRIDGFPMPLTQLPGTGSGIFPRHDQLASLRAEREKMKANFKKKEG